MDDAARFDRLFAQVESLMQAWRLEEATQLLEAARSEGGFPNRLHHDLSVLYAQQGFFTAALAEIEAAMAREPSNRAIWHHFLAIQKNNPAQPSAAEWRAMHLAFGDTLRERHDERHLEAVRSTAPGRKLRIGYLCPDTHLATERFVWPVLELFDGSAFEVFAYWAHAADLDALERSYPRVGHRSLRGLGDAAVASMIVADAIDIAVDVAGHGAGNVLTALASRPAPVAATWLDYLATTGMEEVDFRITDAIADPTGAEEAHVERLLRLPSAQWCYRPPASVREAAVVARAERPQILFGSVSVPLKLSDPLLDLWARLLQRVPASRLRFLGLPEGRARERIRSRMEAGGIEAARVEMRPRLAPHEFHREVADLDVVLDTYPFSGATSNLDALWQGVPVVTLAGPLSHGRSAASILTALGRPEWIAESPESFLDIASALAADASRLSRERAALRRDLQASSLCDGTAFAAAMETALRDAWKSRRPAPAARSRDATAAFWRGLSSMPAADPKKRTTIAGIAQVVDCARGDPRAAMAESELPWILLTDTEFFDAGTLSTTVPTEILERFDALASIGADELSSGDPTTAGQGRVCGADAVVDPQAGRIYASAWLPAHFGRCAVLSGGALLARRELVSRWWAPPRAASAARFRGMVTCMSRRMEQGGARLGVSVALMAAQRSWPEDGAAFAVNREVERALDLPRWGQRRPGARALKAVLAVSAWAHVLPGLERACAVPIQDRKETFSAS